MRKQLLTGVVLLGTLATSPAAIYSLGTVDEPGTSLGSLQNTTIVDGNPAYVIANTMDLSSVSLGSSLSSITVTLNISGGYNNGLYAYLVNGSTTVTLMNQPGYADGFGSTAAGMNVTLSDAGSTSIQSVTGSSAVTGIYSAAGNLSDFSGSDPNGVWTLYFADTIGGGGNATLNGWSLDITAVPESVNVALGIFGGLLGLAVLRQKLKFGKQKAEMEKMTLSAL